MTPGWFPAEGIDKTMSKSKANATPGHYTDKGTRKYQANGPIEWSKVFRRAAGKDGREGEGIRAALAYAVDHEPAFLKWSEAHGATEAAPPKPKAVKAPKAPPKPKAVKAPKAPKAPKADTPKAEG